MATQPPERPLPPSSLFDAIPDIVSRLRDRSLLVGIMTFASDREVKHG